LLHYFTPFSISAFRHYAIDFAISLLSLADAAIADAFHYYLLFHFIIFTPFFIAILRHADFHIAMPCHFRFSDFRLRFSPCRHFR
jgi:hypothetical protein